MQRILVLADIHGNAESAVSAVVRNPDISLVLIAGDLTNFGDAASAAQVLSGIRRVMKPAVPVLAVPGNCDPSGVRHWMRSEAISVENSARDILEMTVAGAGGGLRRAGITSYERTEEQLELSLNEALKDLDSGTEASLARTRARPLLILSHTPPYGTNADLHGGLHVGSKALSAAMSLWAPQVWVCGHIHESRCVSREDGSLVINPGPANYGYFAVLEMETGIEGFTFNARLSR